MQGMNDRVAELPVKNRLMTVSQNGMSIWILEFEFSVLSQIILNLPVFGETRTNGATEKLQPW